MKKLWSLSVVFGMMLFGSFVIAAETYTFGVIPIVGTSYLKVAEVKGFWEKQGVSVKVSGYAVPIDCIRGAVQRRFDMLHVPVAVLSTIRSAGATNAVYLGTFNIADMHKYLLVKDDLLKKRENFSQVGLFSKAISNQFLLTNYLRSQNLSLADVQQVEMNSMDLEANFRHNRLQAILCLEYGNAFYKQADGVIALSTREFYEPHGLVLVRKGGLSSFPQEDLKKILSGCVEAIQWLRDPANWDEYKVILNEYCLPDKPGASDEELRALLTQFKFLPSEGLSKHNKGRLAEYFTKFHAFLEDEHLMAPQALDEFTYKHVIQNQALLEVLQEYTE